MAAHRPALAAFAGDSSRMVKILTPCCLPIAAGRFGLRMVLDHPLREIFDGQIAGILLS